MAGRIGHCHSGRNSYNIGLGPPTPPEEQPGSPNPEGAVYDQNPGAFDQGFNPDGRSSDHGGWGGFSEKDSSEGSKFGWGTHF